MTAIIVPIDCSQAAEIQKFSMMSQNVLSKRDVQDQHHPPHQPRPESTTLGVCSKR